MNLARKFDSRQSREKPWVLLALYLETMEQNLRSYPNYKCSSAAVWQRLCSLNVDNEFITNRTPWDLTQFTRRSPKKRQRPRAEGVLLHVHRGLGLEKQLDHLRVATARRFVERGLASVRSRPCGRSAAARTSHHMPSH